MKNNEKIENISKGIKNSSKRSIRNVTLYLKDDGTFITDN